MKPLVVPYTFGNDLSGRRSRIQGLGHGFKIRFVAARRCQARRFRLQRNPDLNLFCQSASGNSPKCFSGVPVCAHVGPVSLSGFQHANVHQNPYGFADCIATDP
jgi:hypothetical protein